MIQTPRGRQNRISRLIRDNTGFAILVAALISLAIAIVAVIAVTQGAECLLIHCVAVKP